MDRVRKAFGLAQIGFARLPPQEIGVRRVSEAARNRVFNTEPRADAEKPFRGALAGDERAIAFVDVAGQQLRRLRVGAAQQHRRHALDIGRETGGVERPEVLTYWHENFAAEM